MLERLKPEVQLDIHRIADDGVVISTLFCALAVVVSCILFVAALAEGELTEAQTLNSYIGAWVSLYSSMLLAGLWVLALCVPIFHRNRGESLAHTILSVYWSATVLLSATGAARVLVNISDFESSLDAGAETNIEILVKYISKLADPKIILIGTVVVATAVTIAEVYPRVYGEFEARD